MILDNPLFRLALKAISAFGFSDNQRDFDTSRGNRVEQRDSPFVLVGPAPDGRWGVFQRDFNNPRASFDGLQDACNYASELAGTRTDSMVLIQKRRDSAANRDSSVVKGTI